MFTGLIERVATLLSSEDAQGFRVLKLAIKPLPNQPAYATQLGESIAVNGCCLTVTEFTADTMQFDVSIESLAKTNLGLLKVGSTVNLERAMRLGDRLGGHMVSGHVDGKGLLESIDKRDGGWNVWVRLPRELAKYVIPKGSITLDGVSLTVNDVDDQVDGCVIRLTLIPATVELTTFSALPHAWPLNVEVDLVGKYLERFASPYVKI